MLCAALLSLLAAATPLAPPKAGAAPPADPAVRVSLDHHEYDRGDHPRVTVRARDDGYLVVLHLDPDGRVRVLFPLDPGDDNFVRGGEEYEIRGRGDRAPFRIDGSDGSGTVYAAWSRDPFQFDDLVRGDHWDYRVIDDSALAVDPEQGLTNIVERMGGGHFDYDLVSYDVAPQVAYAAPVYVPVYQPTYWPAYYASPFSRCDIGWDAWCGWPPYYPYYRSGFGFSVNVFFGSPWRPWWYHDRYFHGYGHGCWSCGYGQIFIPGRHRYDGWGRFADSPYRFKSGSPGGGGGVGVHYRPRSGWTGASDGPTSPLFISSKFRRRDGGVGGTPWRTPVARPATLGGPVGPRHEPSIGHRGRGAGAVQGGARSGDALDAPRRDGQGGVYGPRRIERAPGTGRGIRPADTPRGETPGRARPQEPRVWRTYPTAPRSGGEYDAPRGADAPSRGADRYDAPRRATPRSDGPRIQPHYPTPGREDQRYQAPRTDAPRYDAPRYEAPRSEAPRYEAPRDAPRAAPPRMEGPRRVEAPRAAPRSAPAPRSGEGRRP